MLRMNKLVSMVVAIVLCLTLFPAASFAALQPFHSPAETSGSIQVKLHPTENVATGTNQLVTFGVPFPRGSVTGGAHPDPLYVLHQLPEFRDDYGGMGDDGEKPKRGDLRRTAQRLASGDIRDVRRRR